MTCLLAPKYVWCKDLPDECQDAVGNSYCQFHAPRGRKKLKVKEFNELVFERIKERYDLGKPCELSGTVFEGEIRFEGFTSHKPLCKVDFSDAVFNDMVDFSSAEFLDTTIFTGSIFYDEARFVEAVFGGRALFEAITFHRATWFTKARFRSGAYFFDSVFCEKADFTGVDFAAESYFSLGAFKAGATFEGAKYGARAIFKRPIGGIPQES